jgi:hypothetical protein
MKRASWYFGGFDALAAAIAFAALGCSSPTPPPDPGCKSFDYGAYMPGAKQQSFKNDVVPIFARACAFSSCHASEVNPMGGLYLGPNVNNVMGGSPSATPPFYPPDDATLAKIHAGLVGAKGKLPVTMLLVQANSPKDSFLMHKIDGDQACVDIACNAISTGKCGQTMPQLSTPLEADAAGAIRDWIAQGAANN